MSGIFQRYALVYDRIYAEKDYRAEVDFTARRLACGPAGCSLVDIGCGTGRHLAGFAELGFTVTGVDASPAMVAIAAARQPAGEFIVGDARELALGRHFSAAVSLFHVMSYMAGPGDLVAALRAVRRHLRPGAPFLFDFWNASGVEADPPTARERSYAVDGGEFVRRTTPTWDRAARTVGVRIEVEAHGPAFGGRWVSSEDHLMRYFAVEELASALESNGFRVTGSGAWLQDRALLAHDWNGWIRAEAT